MTSYYIGYKPHTGTDSASYDYSFRYIEDALNVAKSGDIIYLDSEYENVFPVDMTPVIDKIVNRYIPIAGGA